MSIAVYLAGAMDYVGDYAKRWRKSATESLMLLGYKVYDPTSIPEEPDMTPDEIAQKNLFMQRRADLLLVEYMIPNRSYIGTDFELTWAKLNNQPCVVFCCEENKNRVYLKFLSTKLASSMEEAVEYISTNYPSN